MLAFQKFKYGIFSNCSMTVVSVLMFFGYQKPEWEAHVAEHWYNITLFNKWIKDEAVLDVIDID